MPKTTVPRRPLLALALAATMAGPATAGITDMPGYEGIRVWETTYSLQESIFNAGDARLTTVLAGAALSQASRDFGFFAGNENYDLYLSDATGQLDPHGSYLTIDGNCDVSGANCFNIAEVAVRIHGSNQFSSGVVRAVYGRSGSFTPGSASLAVDGDFNTFTRMGDTTDNYPAGRMSITLGFANVPAVPEPGTWALMLVGMLGLCRLAAWRRG